MALTAGGQTIPQSVGPGVGLLDMLTQGSSFMTGTGTGQLVASPAPAAPSLAAAAAKVPASAAAYLGTLGAILVILLVLKFAMEHEKSGMEPHLLGIGMWNLVAVSTMAVLGIAGTKIIVNKYASGYKPLVDIVNMV